MVVACFPPEIDAQGVWTFTVIPTTQSIFTKGKIQIINTTIPMFPPHSHIFKQLEMVQQEQLTLVVVVDRSCLYAPDAWSVGGLSDEANVWPVCSEQVVGQLCPCCHRTSFA